MKIDTITIHTCVKLRYNSVQNFALTVKSMK